MHHCGQRAALTLALAATLATVPASLQGQTPARVRPPQPDWAISARVGYAMPLNDLGRAQDNGPTFGVGIDRVIERRAQRNAPLWTGRVDLNVTPLPGAADLPKATLIRYTLGADYWFVGGRQSLWSVRAGGAVGGTTISSEDRLGGGDPSGTFFTVAGGLNFGVSVLFFETEWSTIVGANRLRGKFGVPGNFKSLHTLSVKAGVRIPL